MNMRSNTINEKKAEFLANVEKFDELKVRYGCAIREVRTKVEVLNDEWSIRNKRNPIEFITARVKSPESIVDKLERKGLDMSFSSISKNINDIAGIRIICSFIQDIYHLADMIIRQDDVTLVEWKDYIKNPKDNGYRSLHLVLDVPVFFQDGKMSMRVELQIRTLAMDFWASLEHQLRYKKGIKNAEEVGLQLKECADTIHDMDEKMQNIQRIILQS